MFCELIDFFKRTVHDTNLQRTTKVYLMWNRVEYRPLEGFVYAITPSTLQQLLETCLLALMGNVVVWKPAATQVYSAAYLMQIFKETGLPNGINMGDSGMITETLLASPDFAGVHFTGSTGFFDIWAKWNQHQQIQNLSKLGNRW
jgi:1-pyrroline-5-carboxylate dehydrogenase